MLNVYAYRWIYTGSAAGNYTGAIYAYNFQTQQFVENVYENGKRSKYAILANNASPLTTGSTLLKVNLADMLRKVWCFLTGGSWDNADAYNGSSGGVDGNLGPGCRYDPSNTNYIYFYADPNPDFWIWVNDVGVVEGAAPASGGGGSDWGPPPCPPGDSGNGGQNNLGVKLKTNQLDPGDGSGCSTSNPGQWAPF